MKGVVFNLLNDMVERKYGLEAWDALLSSTGLDGIYVATESYPDAELYALVGAASEMTSIDAADLVREFGRHMIPSFVRQYPVFFRDGMRLKDFLLTIDQVVHVEVSKLFPDAGLPEFRYSDDAPDQLVMLYRSPRKLCGLAEGLIDGAASHFGEQYSLDHQVCMHHGDDHCELRLKFHEH